MKAEVKEQWVKALRSGEYRQATDQLHDTRAQGGFCCLGVLCDLAVKAGAVGVYNDGKNYGAELNGEALPAEVQKWAGLESDNPRVQDPHASGFRSNLAYLNDCGMSFARIANIIESEL